MPIMSLFLMEQNAMKCHAYDEGANNTDDPID